MKVTEDPSEWAKETFGSARLGDPRRTARVVKIAGDKAVSMAGSIPEMCTDSAAQEGAYRLMGNDNVDAEEIVEAGCNRTAEIAQQCEGVLLAIQDSTTLSYEHDVEGAGPLGGPGNSGRGIWVHSTLLAAPDVQQVVGIVEQTSWVRSFEQTKHKRAQRAYEEKESYRWEQTDRQMRERLGEEVAARTIVVADREAESVELLGYLLAHGRRFVLRSRTNRILAGKGKLHSPSHYRVLGQATINLMQRGKPNGRAKRATAVEVRAGKAQLKAKSSRYSEVQEVHVIHVREITPGAKGKPLEWWLLTTEPVATLKQAWTCVEYYRCRWMIEDFHKAWKSGTKVEELQFQYVENIRRYAAILTFVAVRLLQLRELAQQFPDASAEVFFSAVQWKVLWLTEQKLWSKSKRKRKLPKKPPSLRWAHNVLARLGGFKDSKRTGRPGWDPLWDGYLALEERVEGFQLALEAVGADL